MYSGSEDGTVRIWDLRAPGCQREYQSRAAVNTVVLHPNQGELISGVRRCHRPGYESMAWGCASALCGLCWQKACARAYFVMPYTQADAIILSRVYSTHRLRCSMSCLCGSPACAVRR